MGDAVLAIFNFPMRREDHAAQAVAAAREIQELWRARREELSQVFGNEAASIGVGIGLDTGKVNFGEFGRTHHDLTAIGTVVNVASRAQSAAAPDQILITAAVREKAEATLAESAGRDYQLRGDRRARQALGGLRGVLPILASGTRSEAFQRVSAVGAGVAAETPTLHEQYVRI